MMSASIKLSIACFLRKMHGARLSISYHNHYLRRLADIDTTDMDDIRNSLSKLKKDFKHRIGGKKTCGEQSWSQCH